MTVSYGMRANEEGLPLGHGAERRGVRRRDVRVRAIPMRPARSAALASRVGTNLASPVGTQKIEDIETDLAGAQDTLRSAADRHRQTKSTLAGMMQEIEGVLDRGGRRADPGAADPPAGVAADDVAAVPDQSRELSLTPISAGC